MSDSNKDTVWGRFVELVRLEQTVFALPFAYVGMFLAARGWPGTWTFFWVTLAMVGARTAGMSANRLIDARIDAANPRTAGRILPSGRGRPLAVGLVMLASLALLALSAWMLNPVCFKLCPLAVALLLVYSYLKRITWACHLGLGLVQACAPLGGWLAVSPSLPLAPRLLGLSSFLWVAGFDMLYACQDTEHDRRVGLFSLPARLGNERAFKVARLFHAGVLACLLGAGLSCGLGTTYFAGLGFIAAVLVWEHSLLAPDDLSKMQQAFFVANALVSVTLLAAVILEVLW